MALLDLCPIETWKSLEDEIRSRTGLNAAVFDIEGIRIIPTETWPNRLCPEIKANPKGQSFICATAHMNIAILAKASKEPVIEECDAGLIKVVVPIFVNDEFVGAVSGCGLLLDDGEVDTFLVSKTTEIEETRLERLAEGIPALAMAEAQALCQFIKAKVEQIVSAYQKRIK